MSSLIPLIGVVVLSAPGDPADLAASTRDIFEHRCAECHGPGVAKPKGKFGFVTDLARLAKSPEYIVPGDPGQSDLWARIDEGDMPPKKAKNGPLTQDEMDTVVAWIKAGAPAPSEPPAPSPTNTKLAPELNPKSSSTSSPVNARPPTSLPTGAPQGPTTVRERAIEMLGRFHVLVIHFPIALLMLAGMAETWRVVRRSTQAIPVVRTSLAIGALSAAAAAGLGWIHAREASELAYSTLWFHRWLGTGSAGFSFLVMALYEWRMRRGRIGLWLSIIVLLSSIAVGATAHFGGLLTHGESFYAPLWR